MSIDITAEVIIGRHCAEVATFAMDPVNDPTWIGGISESRMLTDPPMAKGARVSRVASFLGKRIEHGNEVDEYDPPRLLAMHSVAGPFPMNIRYQFEEAGQGTLTRIRVQGEATGFFKLATPLLARMVKGRVSKDLRALKRIMESGG